MSDDMPKPDHVWVGQRWAFAGDKRVRELELVQVWPRPRSRAARERLRLATADGDTLRAGVPYTVREGRIVAEERRSRKVAHGC